MIEESSIVEFVPDALVNKSHRSMQAFKNFNIVEFLADGSLLVEYSVNPRVILQVDPSSGLWHQVAESSIASIPGFLQSRFFYRGGFCCVGSVQWNGLSVRLGITHIKFNRYLFLHRIYAVRTTLPHDIVGLSPKFCLHFPGNFSTAWRAELVHGCETLQFASGMTLLTPDSL